MGIKYIKDGILYKNSIPHVYSRQAYFPSVLQLTNGDLLSTFCIGQAFESPDLHTYVARSIDNGENWSLQGRIYEGTSDRITSDVCRLSHGDNGEIIAYMIRHDRSRKSEGLANPENLGFVEIEQLLFRSLDEGRTWSKPEKIIPPIIGPSFEMTSPIVPLKNGSWILPTSTWRGWDGHCPNGMKMVIFISWDKGQTWDDYMDVMVDEKEEIIFWESKVIELFGGKLLAVSWAFNESKGIDLDNQYSISSGLMEPFTPYQSTGLKGQTLNLIQLENGKLLTVYRRTDKAGLWANLSRLEGNKWINDGELPLWGNSKKDLISQEENMVQNFNKLKFGVPSINKLQDGTIYVTFWAEEDCVSSIRWIKLVAE